MRFVETKTAVQKKCLMLHRARNLFFRQQNAVINPIRAHLAELGVGHMTMTSATGTSLLSRFDRRELESESSGKRFEVNDGGALFPGCDGPPHGAARGRRDVSISGKKWLPAAGVLMRAAEQCLSEVKQCISSPRITKID